MSDHLIISPNLWLVKVWLQWRQVGNDSVVNLEPNRDLYVVRSQLGHYFSCHNHIHSFNHAFSCQEKSMNTKQYVFLFAVYIMNIKFKNVYLMALKNNNISGTSESFTYCFLRYPEFHPVHYLCHLMLYAFLNNTWANFAFLKCI